MFRNLIILVCAGTLSVSAASATAAGKGKKSDKSAIVKKYAKAYKKNMARYKKGLKRINTYRALANVGPMKLDQKLGMAAQAHADYLVQNKFVSHQQKPGTPGFIGREFTHRAAFFGAEAAFECISTYPDPAKAVDGHIASVYHRLPFLDPDKNKVGLGIGTNVTVADFGDGPKKRGVRPALFPANEQEDVPRSWLINELPNPVEQFGSPKVVGFPISARFYSPVVFVSVNLSCAEQKDVPVFAVHKDNDNTGLLKNEIFILSKVPMKPATKYSVSLTVKLKGARKLAKWSFTTAPTPSK